MKVKANGIAINYRIDGPERAPWLVFSNSLATSLAMWDEQAAALADSFRVLRYDQRGAGLSEAPSVMQLLTWTSFSTPRRRHAAATLRTPATFTAWNSDRSRVQ